MNALYKNESPEMILAFEKALTTFKYFWREMYWEYRRIVPAFELAYVKCAFSQDNPEDPNEPYVEYMWINEVDFDGYNISGILLNEPHYIDQVEAGAAVKLPLESIVDWMFLSNGTIHGAFSIQEYRKTLTAAERQEYDEAWGIDFGDPNEIYVVHDQKNSPENLDEHPMAKNILDQFLTAVTTNPAIITDRDEAGNQQLHREAIAGNALFVQALLKLDADRGAVNAQSHTAADLAEKMDWLKIVDLFK